MIVALSAASMPSNMAGAAFVDSASAIAWAAATSAACAEKCIRLTVRPAGTVRRQ